MTDDRYLPGVPCWVEAMQPDPVAAADFYGALFGWSLRETLPPGADGTYLTASIEGEDVAAITTPSASAPQAAAWNTYVRVGSADAIVGRVQDAGGDVLAEPFDVPDAGRMAVFADREGAAFSVWEPGRFRGATRVNAHGAVNFNDLHTRDAEAARAFYGAVFGWGVLEFGENDFMWTLPAYGDLLEARTPGTREQMAQAGAPDGFLDVVAAAHVLGTDDPGTPPHWSVTFAVDDADAIAHRAEALGARVLAGPFDAPWVRMAVLADPQGTTFVASQYVPEQR